MSCFAGPDIVNSGLVLHLDAVNSRSYPNTGTVWTNLIGGNAATLTNGPTYIQTAFTFDGVNDYAIISRPTSIITGGSISVQCWAKWVSTGTTVSTIQALVDNNHSASPQQGFILQDRPDLNKSLTWSVRPSANGVVSTFQVGDGKWHHIVGTNDGVTSKLYIDGSLNASYSEAGLATVQPNISIGYWQFTPGRYLNGSIGQVQVYSRALTLSEVQQNYEAFRGRYGI